MFRAFGKHVLCFSKMLQNPSPAFGPLDMDSKNKNSAISLLALGGPPNRNEVKLTIDFVADAANIESPQPLPR